MKKKTVIIYTVICTALFVTGMIGSVISLNRPHGSRVEIISDGVILCTVDLELSEDEVFTVEYENRKNIIEIKDRRIRVKDADCPDRVCVRTGWLTTPSIPIICLPNRLEIRYSDDGGIDAAAK